jgi:hypothetical protein
MPFTSSTSSPSCSRPLFSAAPPRTIRPIITASPSFRTVAPCKIHKQLFNNHQHCTYSMSTVRTALFCHYLWLIYSFLHTWIRQQAVCSIEGLGMGGWVDGILWNVTAIGSSQPLVMQVGRMNFWGMYL